MIRPTVHTNPSRKRSFISTVTTSFPGPFPWLGARLLRLGLASALIRHENALKTGEI